MTDKVDIQTAENEFVRWATEWSIATDTNDMNKEDAESFDVQKKRVVKAIQQGKLTVSETGDAITLDSDKGAITFKEPTGAAYLAMDQHKGKDMGAMFGFMGAMSGNPAKMFASVRGSDLKLAQAITALFLAS